MEQLGRPGNVGEYPLHVPELPRNPVCDVREANRQNDRLVDPKHTECSEPQVVDQVRVIVGTVDVVLRVVVATVFTLPGEI